MSGKPFSFEALSKYPDAVFQASDTVAPQQQIECPDSLTTPNNSTTPISKNQLESKLQYITYCSNRLTIPYRSFDPGINSYNKINDSTYGSENNVIGGYGANTYYLKRVKKANLLLSKVKHKFSIIINPTVTGRFSGIYSEFEIESNDGRDSITIPIVLTEDEYNGGKFGRKLSSIITNRANPEYRNEYAVALYYHLIKDEISMKSNCFIPPPCSGWSKLPEGLFFASANSVNPILYDYLDSGRKKHQIPCYPDDIFNRTLLHTSRIFSDVAKEYKNRLPDNWKYKLLVVIRVASLLLYFFKQKDIEPDQIFIIEPSHHSDAKDVIALLQTNNYDNYSPILMPFSQTKYNNICKDTFSNDGIALFRDESLVEEKSVIASNIRLLKNSIKYHSTDESNKRQILAIITNNQIIGSDDTSAIQLTFQDVEDLTDEQDIKYIQNLSGQFDFSLIQYIIENESKMAKKIYSLIDKYKEFTMDEYHERINTIRILETTMEFLKEYEIVMPIEKSDNQTAEPLQASDITDSSQNIVTAAEHNASTKISQSHLKITVLIEDTTNCELESENGLSLYIEYNDKKILFDAGRENLFAKNADLMLIDLSEIDFGILSHAHSMVSIFSSNSKALSHCSSSSSILFILFVNMKIFSAINSAFCSYNENGSTDDNFSNVFLTFSTFLKTDLFICSPSFSLIIRSSEITPTEPFDICFYLLPEFKYKKSTLNFFKALDIFIYCGIIYMKGCCDKRFSLKF